MANFTPVTRALAAPLTKIPRSGLESRDLGRNPIGSGHAGSAPTLLLAGRNAKLGKFLGRCGFGSDSGNYSDSNVRSDSEVNLSTIPVQCKMFRLLCLIIAGMTGETGEKYSNYLFRLRFPLRVKCRSWLWLRAKCSGSCSASVSSHCA